MNKLVLVFLTFFGLLASGCITAMPKPDLTGTDPSVQSYVDEYIRLAKLHDIKFNTKVNVGLSHINRNGIVGLCTYGDVFREIHLDNLYWRGSTELTRKALVFHECSHCFCGRQHDYGEGKVYPDNAVEELTKQIKAGVDTPPGYFEDLCSVSLMHPSLMSDFCIKKHYLEYIEEMFDRCEPY